MSLRLPPRRAAASPLSALLYELDEEISSAGADLDALLSAVSAAGTDPVSRAYAVERYGERALAGSVRAGAYARLAAEVRGYLSDLSDLPAEAAPEVRTEAERGRLRILLSGVRDGLLRAASRDSDSTSRLSRLLEREEIRARADVLDATRFLVE